MQPEQRRGRTRGSGMRDCEAPDGVGGRPAGHSGVRRVTITSALALGKPLRISSMP